MKAKSGNEKSGIFGVWDRKKLYREWGMDVCCSIKLKAPSRYTVEDAGILGGLATRVGWVGVVKDSGTRGPDRGGAVELEGLY